jgi:hypothetical protein
VVPANVSAIETAIIDNQAVFLNLIIFLFSCRGGKWHSYPRLLKHFSCQWLFLG